MATKEEKAINITGAEDVPVEIVAEAIVRISAGVDKLLASGLNRRALLVLLKDASGVPMDQIGRVLNALPQLASTYTLPKRAKGK